MGHPDHGLGVALSSAVAMQLEAADCACRRDRSQHSQSRRYLSLVPARRISEHHLGYIHIGAGLVASCFRLTD